MSPKRTERRPRVFGAGLIALDTLVGTGRVQRRTAAGGTCGNVLIILSGLGWEAFPLAHLKTDTAGRRLVADLRRWGVRLRFARLRPQKRTPVVVHRIVGERSGKISHRFSWMIAPLTPLEKQAAKIMASRIVGADVLFIDRVFPGVIDIAKAARRHGSLVVFEPPGIRDPRLFRELVNISHIVKYSRERLGRLANGRPTLGNLEIETRGRDGLRYRTKLRSCMTRGWQILRGVPARCVRDSAGAGDWCTAGIIHYLGRGGSKKFSAVTAHDLQRALMFGQALAAWNVGFEGARGAMYGISSRAFKRRVEAFERSTQRNMGRLLGAKEAFKGRHRVTLRRLALRSTVTP